LQSVKYWTDPRLVGWKGDELPGDLWGRESDPTPTLSVAEVFSKGVWCETRCSSAAHLNLANSLGDMNTFQDE
jgi:hypothetical protein